MPEKKVTERKILKNKTAKKAQNEKGEDRIVIIEETTYYTFTNRRKGPCFFKRETGKEDFFEGHETKKDITERERVALMESKDFSNGWLVEELDKEEVTEASVHNKNTLSDGQLKRFIKGNLRNHKKLKDFLENMTSEFAVTRFKEILVEEDAPSSLVAFSDYRLSQLEEEYLESKKAPIDRTKLEEEEK